MIVVFDLDDTLYNEVDFVKSGFLEVAKLVSDDDFAKIYSFLVESFYKNGSGRVFNDLIEEFKLNIDLNELINLYRFHRPNISLDSDRLTLLQYIKDNYQTGLITDGNYLTQRNKFEALGLESYIDYPIFTSRYSTKKPELKAFKMVQERFKDREFCYISDNPKKDFFAPNELNWLTIRYKNPVGIYREFENNAEYEVTNILEVIDIL